MIHQLLKKKKLYNFLLSHYEDYARQYKHANILAQSDLLLETYSLTFLKRLEQCLLILIICIFKFPYLLISVIPSLIIMYIGASYGFYLLPMVDFIEKLSVFATKKIIPFFEILINKFFFEQLSLQNLYYVSIFFCFFFLLQILYDFLQYFLDVQNGYQDMNLNYTSLFDDILEDILNMPTLTDFIVNNKNQNKNKNQAIADIFFFNIPITVIGFRYYDQGRYDETIPPTYIEYIIADNSLQKARNGNAYQPLSLIIFYFQFFQLLFFYLFYNSPISLFFLSFAQPFQIEATFNRIEYFLQLIYTSEIDHRRKLLEKIRYNILESDFQRQHNPIIKKKKMTPIIKPDRKLHEIFHYRDLALIYKTLKIRTKPIFSFQIKGDREKLSRKISFKNNYFFGDRFLCLFKNEIFTEKQKKRFKNIQNKQQQRQTEFKDFSQKEKNLLRTVFINRFIASPLSFLKDSNQFRYFKQQLSETTLTNL